MIRLSLNQTSAHILLRPPTSQITSRSSEDWTSLLLEKSLLLWAPIHRTLILLLKKIILRQINFVISKIAFESIFQILLLLNPKITLVPSRVPEDKHATNAISGNALKDRSQMWHLTWLLWLHLLTSHLKWLRLRNSSSCCAQFSEWRRSAASFLLRNLEFDTFMSGTGHRVDIFSQYS